MHQFSERRVLVVEDEALIGLDVKDTLVALGCQVLGPIATVATAIRTVTTNHLDAAVLDINLGKELSFPIADALSNAAVPFIFLTGYNREIVPVAHRNRPLVRKPFLPKALVAELARVLAA